MKSDAATVKEYLASLPAGRREAIAAVRDLVNRKLPKGYEETMAWGMITWQVPWSVCSDTYNGKPLAYVALASQKQNMAVYLAALYVEPGFEARFREEYAQAGKKLNMGKSCVRFRKLEDLHLPAIGRAVAAWPMAEYVRRARAAHDPTPREPRGAASGRKLREKAAKGAKAAKR